MGESRPGAGGDQALHEAYRQRETVFAAVMADRADWEAATRQQRHLAVGADAELRRRHPGQYFSPLRSAEPEPATGAQRDELTLTTGDKPGEKGGRRSAQVERVPARTSATACQSSRTRSTRSGEPATTAVFPG